MPDEDKINQDEIDSLLDEAEKISAGDKPASFEPVSFKSLEAAAGLSSGAGIGGGPAPRRPVKKDNIDLLLPVAMDVTIELGRTRVPLEDVLRLGDGSVVVLDKLAGDPLDILVNGQLIARGEVLILNDRFCIRVTDVLPPEDRKEIAGAGEATAGGGGGAAR